MRVQIRCLVLFADTINYWNPRLGSQSRLGRHLPVIKVSKDDVCVSSVEV